MSSWKQYVNTFRREHPTLSYKECLQECSKSYKKQTGKGLGSSKIYISDEQRFIESYQAKLAAEAREKEERRVEKIARESEQWNRVLAQSAKNNTKLFLEKQDELYKQRVKREQEIMDERENRIMREKRSGESVEECRVRLWEQDAQSTDENTRRYARAMLGSRYAREMLGKGVCFSTNRDNRVAPFQGERTGTPPLEYELTAEERAEAVARAEIINSIINDLRAANNTPAALLRRRLRRGVGRSGRRARAEMALREETRQAETTGRGVCFSTNRNNRVAPFQGERTGTPPLSEEEVELTPEERAIVIAEEAAAEQRRRLRRGQMGILRLTEQRIDQQLQRAEDILEDFWE
jgi:hypothetical protein